VHANPRADRRLRVSIATGDSIRVIHLNPRSRVNPGRLVEHAQRKVGGAFAAYGSFWFRFVWFMAARVVPTWTANCFRAEVRQSVETFDSLKDRGYPPQARISFHVAISAHSHLSARVAPRARPWWR
jgi:hypothetical protein